jgi:hypothetical protein
MIANKELIKKYFNPISRVFTSNLERNSPTVFVKYPAMFISVKCTTPKGI